MKKFYSLFQNSSQWSPEEIQNTPKIFWSVSQKPYYRPISLFSDGYRQTPRWIQTAGQLTKPELYIFTCLMSSDRLRGLVGSFETGCIHYDGTTQIIVESYTRIHLDRENYHYEINNNFFTGDPQDFNSQTSIGCDGIFANLLLVDLSTGYSERAKLLYLFCENINFYQQVVQSGCVKLIHLATVSQGLGRGNCGQGIIDFTLGQPQYNPAEPFPDIQTFCVPNETPELGILQDRYILRQIYPTDGPMIPYSWYPDGYTIPFRRVRLR